MANDIDLSYCDSCRRGNIENKLDHKNSSLWDKMLKTDHLCLLFALI